MTMTQAVEQALRESGHSEDTIKAGRNAYLMMAVKSTWMRRELGEDEARKFIDEVKEAFAALRKSPALGDLLLAKLEAEKKEQSRKN